jgi:hypothetical protein
VSARQAHDWRKLDDVPQEQFEAALADPNRMPTTKGYYMAIDGVHEGRSSP